MKSKEKATFFHNENMISKSNLREHNKGFNFGFDLSDDQESQKSENEKEQEEEPSKDLDDINISYKKETPQAFSTGKKP